ncbi:hypothetical protein AVEN_66824-1 [Araneus ventricosus]|uniref:RNase H type-1 domain-containing protein n=1 Tax=Araneus ventricosus TaxID=182803 RepID=A0A4Y2DS83_ARAVE|nr:hypothetical protein AVEN_66824-1 [Araneus ventricosus]
MLEIFAFPQIEDLQPNIIFQQDGSPPHWSLEVRKVLDENFPSRWIGSGGPIPWPPRFPDITSLDFLWGYVKNIVYQSPIRDIDELKSRTKAVIQTVDSAVLHRTCIDDNTGLSVCNFPKDETPDVYCFKLNKNYTVFLAELAAIDFGVRCALENHKSINIHTDSRSSIEALRSARPRSVFLISVKKNFYVPGDLVGLDWVKAHIGDPGNELAERHAKLAALEGEELGNPTPYSYIKLKIYKELIKNCQCSWDNYDSESARRVRSYVPCVDKKFLIYNKFLIFLTSHGPFPFISIDLKISILHYALVDDSVMQTTTHSTAL